MNDDWMTVGLNAEISKELRIMSELLEQINPDRLILLMAVFMLGPETTLEMRKQVVLGVLKELKEEEA